MKFMAEFGLNISPFQAGMKQAEKVAEHGMENIGHHVKGLIAGYFGFEALKEAFVGVAEKAIKIGEMAKQFSLTTDEVQKLGIAAEHVGLDFESMGAGIDRLGKARKEAAEGNERLIYIFNRLGIGQLATDLEHISDLDLAKKLGEAFSKIEINSETREFLRELMGRGGPRMLEALKGLEHVEHEPLISKEDIDNIHEAEISIKRLQREWAAFVAPHEAAGANVMDRTLKAFREESAKGHDDTLIGRIVPDWMKKFVNVNWNAIRAGHDAVHFEKEFADMFAGGLKIGIPGAPANNEHGGKAGEKAALPIVSPREVTEMLKAQFALQERIEAITFDRANTSGKIAIFQQKIKESHESELRLAQQLHDKKIDQLEYERHIAEQKKDQLDYEQKIYDLRKASNIGFEGFRKLAAASGFNPATYGQASLTAAGGKKDLTPHANHIVQAMDQVVNLIRKLGEAKIILGR